ncbi:MAG: sporulation protein YunB [Clostridia bacterium]|nr:sporulation protein YunB [Clostridia bacterium]
MGGIGYLDLIILDRDESGKILALRANVIEMNKIASEISSRIQEYNNHLEETYIKIPFGNLTGIPLFSGIGPYIKMKVIPTGTVHLDFKTEFVSTGINQIRHRIYLNIVMSMGIVGPLVTSGVQVNNDVDIAETVLIGEVPETFYHLEGVKELTADDSLNLW